MYSRHVRHLVAELGARLFDREFLKRAGLSRRSVQTVFDREKWGAILSEVLPAKERFTCAGILEYCREELERLCGVPEEGWLSFSYQYSTHILYPDEEFQRKSAPFM